MVGNGQPNADPASVASSGADYGESFLKLTPNGAKLTVSDWFLPNNWASLDAGDTDLGSGGPMLLPGTSYLIGGGKQGVFYVVDTNNMGHYHAGSDFADCSEFSGVERRISRRLRLLELTQSWPARLCLGRL